MRNEKIRGPPECMVIKNTNIMSDFFNILADETQNNVADGLSSAIASIVPPPTSFAVGLASKVIAKWTMANVCHELSQRNMTDRQKEKMSVFAESAVRTFYELMDKGQAGNNNYDSPESDEWRENAYEIAENLFLKAANECQAKKLTIQGSYFGREMFYGTSSWMEIYFLTNLYHELTFRQIIMIKLLVERISPRPKKERQNTEELEFNNSTTYMEFQVLAVKGMFEVGEDSVGWASIDLSSLDYSSDIYTTDLAIDFYDKFILKDIKQEIVDEIVRTF